MNTNKTPRVPTPTAQAAPSRSSPPSCRPRPCAKERPIGPRRAIRIGTAAFLCAIRIAADPPRPSAPEAIIVPSFRNTTATATIPAVPAWRRQEPEPKTPLAPQPPHHMPPSVPSLHAEPKQDRGLSPLDLDILPERRETPPQTPVERPTAKPLATPEAMDLHHLDALVLDLDILSERRDAPPAGASATVSSRAARSSGSEGPAAS